MDLEGRSMVVTGAGRGIGAAIATAFAEAGAHVVVSDLDPVAARTVTERIVAGGGRARSALADVTDPHSVERLVDFAADVHGPVDIFCSNAGVMEQGGPEADDTAWQVSWDVNVMAHVYASRAVLPAMRERGSGCLVNVASAAGLLTSIGAAPYATTKHAAVAFAEWLSITYGDEGISVVCVCPELVDTALLDTAVDRLVIAAIERSSPMGADEVAASVVAAVREDRFFAFPHPRVAELYLRRAADPERWQRGMRRLRARLEGPDPSDG